MMLVLVQDLMLCRVFPGRWLDVQHNWLELCRVLQGRRLVMRQDWLKLCQVLWGRRLVVQQDWLELCLVLWGRRLVMQQDWLELCWVFQGRWLLVWPKGRRLARRTMRWLCRVEQKQPTISTLVFRSPGYTSLTYLQSQRLLSSTNGLT